MKYHHSIKVILLILVSITFWQCEKYEVPPKPVPSPFSAQLENNKASFPATGGTVNIMIDAGADGWWIVVPEQDKSWLNITKIYGAGNFSVPVKILPNKTNAARKVEIMVNPSYNLTPVKLEISQEG